MDPFPQRVSGLDSHVLMGTAALDRLNLIGNRLEWSELCKLLDGVERALDRPIPFSTEVMLRSMLLQQWFALGALEFEHELADRRSFQRFTATSDLPVRPDYVMVNAYRRAVLASGAAPALENALSEEFRKAGVANRPRPDAPSPHEVTGVQAEMSATPYIRSAEWQVLEEEFFEYLEALGGDGGVAVAFPSLPEPGQLKRHFVTIDIIDGGADFRWRYVGDSLVQSNGSDVRGRSLRERADATFREYGHFGVQGEFLTVFGRALRERCPVTAATYFHNAHRARCQIWITVAPFSEAGPSSLAGVALIVPVRAA